MHRNVSSRRRR